MVGVLSLVGVSAEFGSHRLVFTPTVVKFTPVGALSLEVCWLSLVPWEVW